MSIDNKILAGGDGGERGAFLAVVSKTIGKYRTAVLLAVVLIGMNLVPHITPPKPSDSELLHISGKPEIVRSGGITQTRIYFKVAGVTLHCAYNTFSGGNGCIGFKDRIDMKKDVQATYFMMSLADGTRDKMLNTLDQNGHRLITSNETYDIRLLSYQANKTSRLVWSLLIILLLMLLILRVKLDSKVG